jgi:hypothetical protein
MVPVIDRDRWRVLEPLLDRAFDLSAEEQASWLDELRATAPDLAAELSSLLRGEAAADRIGWTRAAVDASTVPATLGALRSARIRRIAAGRLPCIAGRRPHRARRAPSGSTARASRLGTAAVPIAASIQRVVAVPH